MAKAVFTSDNGPLEIDLKEPYLAAFLAWLVPGAGHLYQGRTGKGVLFMICVLSTFFFGLWLGKGHAVYASWRPNDRRLPYLCQVGAGAVALPALVQASRVRSGKEPLLNGLMVPPRMVEHGGIDELSDWNRELGGYFDLSTHYTMIAGLLNVLAILDAFAGPMPAPSQSRPAEPQPAKKEEDAVTQAT